MTFAAVLRVLTVSVNIKYLTDHRKFTSSPLWLSAEYEYELHVILRLKTATEVQKSTNQLN